MSPLTHHPRNINQKTKPGHKNLQLIEPQKIYVIKKILTVFQKISPNLYKLNLNRRYSLI